MIDLRSDTVTLPSPAMRAAMAQAEVGDDVYGEDPTINRLETLAAQMMGKEAALLVASGTMGNLAALLTHCQRGQRVILGSESHIYHNEVGGAAALGGLMYHVVPNQPDGTLQQAALQAAIAHDAHDIHLPPPGVVCLENTHNRCGGTVLTPDYMAHVHALARQHNLPLHLDGARIFNAAVALGQDVQAFTRHVDTIQFCLSKGLAAPVGSMIAGPAAFIRQARKVRKMLGGGMRQAGIIAAAGMVALTEMVERLEDDHRNARLLAEGLAAIAGIEIDLARVQTDIVVFRMTDERLTPASFAAALKEQGVLVGVVENSTRTIRAVTHYGIETAHVQAAIEAVRRVLS